MISTILFDFDGVLSFDRFYTTTLKQEHPEVADWIAKNIFENNKELVRQWMRGDISSAQINQDIAEQTGMDLPTLNQSFEESVEQISLDEDLVALIQKIREQDISVGLVTDNMDVFSEIVVGHLNLNQKFDTVLSSSEYGFLKKEQNGKLFDIALEKLGETDISQSLMVDNQPEVIELYKQKGGQGYVYKNFHEFEDWIGQQLAQNR